MEGQVRSNGTTVMVNPNDQTGEVFQVSAVPSSNPNVSLCDDQLLEQDDGPYHEVPVEGLERVQGDTIY